MAKAKKSTSEVKDIATLRTLDKEALMAELKEAQKALFVLNMKRSLGELKQSHLLKNSRRYIAQISTFLTSAL